MADPFGGFQTAPTPVAQPTSDVSPEEIYNAAVPEDAAFTRAIDSGRLSSEAGGVLRDKLDAELLGDPRKAGALGQRAESLLRSAGAIGPRIQRTGQIHSLGQAGEYALGQLGTMAGQAPPFLAAGVLGRLGGSLAAAKYAPAAGSLLRRALPALSTMGAETAAGYPMMAGAAREAQFADPRIEALPPEQRQAAMREYGLGTAALGAVGPAALLHFPMKGLARYPLGSLAASSVGQGALMAGQEAATQKMLSGLDPQRDTSEDPEALKEAFYGGTVGAGAMVAPGLALRLAMHPAVTALDHFAPPDFSKGINLSGHPVATAAKQFLLGPKDPDLKGILLDDTAGNIDRRMQEAPETGAGLVAHVNNHPGAYSPETHEAARAHDQAATAQGIVLDEQLHKTRSWFKTIADAFRPEKPREGEMLSAGADEKTSEILQILGDHINIDTVRARSGRGVDAVIKRDLPAMARGLASMLARGTSADTSDIPALMRLREAGDYFDNPEQMLKKVAASLGLGDMNPAEFLGKGDPVRDMENPNSMFSLYYEGPEASRPYVADFIRRFVDDPSLPANKLEALGKYFGGEDTARVVMEHYARKQKGTILEKLHEQAADEIAALKYSKQAFTEGERQGEHIFRTGHEEMPFQPDRVGRREMAKNIREFRMTNPGARSVEHRRIPYTEYLRKTGAYTTETAFNKLLAKTKQLYEDSKPGQNKSRLKAHLDELAAVDAVQNPDDKLMQMDQVLSKYQVLERYGVEGSEHGAATDAEITAYTKERHASKTMGESPTITFKIGNRTLRAHTEAMWMHERDSDRKNYEAMPDKKKIKAAFNTALAKLMSRLDVTLDAEQLKGLTIDRKTGLVFDEEPRQRMQSMTRALLDPVQEMHDRAGEIVKEFGELSPEDQVKDRKNFVEELQNMGIEARTLARQYGDQARDLEKLKAPTEQSIVHAKDLRMREEAERMKLDALRDAQNEVNDLVWENLDDVQREEVSQQDDRGERLDWAPELGPREGGSNKEAVTSAPVRPQDRDLLTNVMARAKSADWKSLDPEMLKRAWDAMTHIPHSVEDQRLLEEQISWHAQEQQARDMQERDALRQELFSQGEAPSDEKISPEMRKKVQAEVKRLIKGYELRFADTHKWTGKWTHRMLRKGKAGLKDLIQISLYAGDPMGAGRHEAFHKFFENLGDTLEEQQIKKDFYDIADDPSVIARLIAQYSKTPKEAEKNKAILDQIKGTTDRARRERMAYAYQLWAMDKDMGTTSLNPDALGTIGQKIKDVFRKVADFFASMLGVVSEYGRHEALLSAFHEGKFREAQGVKDFAQNRNFDTIKFRARRLAPDLYRRVSNAFTTATDELRNSRIRSLFDIANVFNADAEHEEDALRTLEEWRNAERTEGNGKPKSIGQLSYLQARIRADNVLKNLFVNALGDAKEADLREALENLQRRKPPGSDLERRLTRFLDEVHDYAERAGVANRVQDEINGKPVVDENGQPVYKWQPIKYLKKYFPQVWDRAKVSADPQGFIDALSKHFPRDDVQALAKHVMGGDGMTPVLADDPNHVGYTPAAAHIKNRGFLTDNPKALEEMAKWQKKDMMDVMTTYLRQVSHRAEYARFFGNDGEMLNKKLAEAKAAGADPKEIARAEHVIKALSGTLRQDMNPELRDIFGTIATYEQVVLLPLTLMSSFVDANNIGVRTGELNDSFTAFKRGIGELVGRIGGKTPADDMTELARTMGVIEHSSMIDRLGSVAGSMYSNERLRRFNNWYFRMNGMESWNQSMRVSALGAGMRFMVRHATKPNAHSERYLRELGVQKGDIKELADGRIATTEKDGLTKAQAMRVRDGLFKFVDSSVLRPSAAQRPAWGSDPMYQLLFHMKSFTFSFQRTVLDRAVETERLNGNFIRPMVMLAGHVPIMMMSDFVRGGMTGVHHTGNLLSYFEREISRAGLEGIGQFGTDAVADMHRHMFPGTSFAGPAIQHAVAVGQALSGDPRESWGKLLVRSLPMSPVIRGLT